MLGPFDYALWVIGFLAEAYVGVSAISRKEFLRYFPLNFYMLVVALITAGQSLVIHGFGFSSVEYRYYYYYTDTLQTVLMYFAIMNLFQHLFHETSAGRFVRGATVLLLAGVAGFSYLVVERNVDHLTSRFVVELAQNLYFVGVVLTYLLWISILKLREARLRLMQLVLALGIYFSATAAAFAMRNMFPTVSFVKAIQPLAGTFLPLAWAYTFTKIPEEARLATAQVATPHR